MAEFDVDLFVIGGGSGGVRAARIAAGHGARVMVAEEYRMGGTCVIRGCVPKKLFVIGSHVHQEIEDAAGFGWTIPPATFDWPTLIANKDKEIARLEGIYTTNVEKVGRAGRQGARGVRGRAHGAPRRRREGHREIHPDRHRRRAQSRRRDPRHRARDLLERGVPSARTAEAHRDPGRRLYRAGIRLHLRRLRLRRDA